MALTANDRARVRTYVVWNPPTDDDLDATYARLLGDDPSTVWQHVAHEYVLTKRNEIASAPSSFTIPGEYSESWNVAALDASLKQIAAITPGVGTVEIGRLRRGGLR